MLFRSAIHDFDATEVRALSGNSKVLYAAVNKMKPATIGYPKVKPSKGKGTAIKKRKVPGSKACRKIPRKGAKKGKGGVFRLWETGAVEQLHGLGKSYFTALEVTPEGDVYAGEGRRGQVFWLGKDGSLATVADVKERQVMALSLTGKMPALATGDSGVLYKRKKAGARRYVSEVLNAKIASRWGRLEWRGSRGVKVEVRSGNTAEADKSWSSWVPLRRVSRTLSGAAGQVGAPAGQYLQYRVVWPGRAGAAVKVEGLKLYFVPMNRQAKVVEIRVHDQKS